jgi:hypothetical protein
MVEETFEYQDKIKGKDHREVLERIDDEFATVEEDVTALEAKVATNVAVIANPTSADSIPTVAAKINDVINALVTAGLMAEAE